MPNRLTNTTQRSTRKRTSNSAVISLLFPDVENVVNFDFPKTVKNYVHRVGR